MTKFLKNKKRFSKKILFFCISCKKNENEHVIFYRDGQIINSVTKNEVINSILQKIKNLPFNDSFLQASKLSLHHELNFNYLKFEDC